jgi:osmotically-inducible protein OsmY
LLHRILFVFLVLSLTFVASRDVEFSAQKTRIVTDDEIVDQVRLKLLGDFIVKGGALQVDCKQGVVSLSGSVETDKVKARAERLARKVKGVKQVVNRLTVRVH